MPIFHQHKTIFIHIPKTAGSTVNSVFGLREVFPISRSLLDFDTSVMYGNTDEMELDHMLAIDMRNLLMPKERHIWESYVKFAIVRNPFDRIVSQYHYCKENNDFRVIGNDESYWETFDSFIQRLDQVWKNFQKLPHKEKSHYIPQYDFVYDTNGNLMVNYVLRFENFNADMNEFRRLTNINIDLSKLHQKLMTSRHDHYVRYFKNQKTIDIIQKLYKKDFEAFGYTMRLDPSS